MPEVSPFSTFLQVLMPPSHLLLVLVVVVALNWWWYAPAVIPLVGWYRRGSVLASLISECWKWVVVVRVCVRVKCDTWLGHAVPATKLVRPWPRILWRSRGTRLLALRWIHAYWLLSWLGLCVLLGGVPLCVWWAFARVWVAAPMPGFRSRVRKEPLPGWW